MQAILIVSERGERNRLKDAGLPAPVRPSQAVSEFSCYHQPYFQCSLQTPPAPGSSSSLLTPHSRMSLCLLSLLSLSLSLALSFYNLFSYLASPGSALTSSRLCVSVAPACTLWTLTGPSFSGTEPDPTNTADTGGGSLGPYPHPACPAQLGPETHTQQ